MATITAGWQERESEVDLLDRELAGQSVNLRLHQRAERVFAEDPELFDAHRDSQRELFQLERHYQIRLAHAMDAALELWDEETSGPALVDARKHSIETLRGVDEWHLDRVDALRAEFDERMRPLERSGIAAERAQLEAIVGEASAVAIAGGHVAVLLNRLRLFKLGPLLTDKPLFVWSAGAMAMTERVVLFHDHPPQGPGTAAVLERGLGRCPGLVALPHGGRRLALDDRRRVARFAQRFDPRRCVLLEAGDRLTWDDGQWSAPKPVRCLSPGGEVVEAVKW